MKTYILKAWFDGDWVVCFVKEISEEKAKEYASKESPHIYKERWDVICIEEVKADYLTILG